MLRRVLKILSCMTLLVSGINSLNFIVSELMLPIVNHSYYTIRKHEKLYLMAKNQLTLATYGLF